MMIVMMMMMMMMMMIRGISTQDKLVIERQIMMFNLALKKVSVAEMQSILYVKLLIDLLMEVVLLTFVLLT